ncbi:MAG: hypothetical protein AAGB34_07880, partial [Planctomycetota bacterium]
MPCSTGMNPNKNTTVTAPRHPRPLGGDPLKRVDRPRISLSAMVLNNQDPAAVIQPKRKPSWLRAKLPGGPGYTRLNNILEEHNLFTVCKEASCPN